MPDLKKRTTLKTLGAAAAISAVPAVVQAATLQQTTETNITAVMAHLQTELAAQGVSLDVVPTPEHASMRVRFTNNGNVGVSLDGVSPCLIRSDGKRYDINSGLQGKPRQIAPNESCTFLIEAIQV